VFRITEDPSSGSLVQCLAKNYKNEWYYRVRWHGQGRCYGSILWPRCACVFFFLFHKSWLTRGNSSVLFSGYLRCFRGLKRSRYEFDNLSPSIIISRTIILLSVYVFMPCAGNLYIFHLLNAVMWDHLGDPGVDGRIILRWFFRKWDVWVWTGSNWLRIGTGSGHLWMR